MSEQHRRAVVLKGGTIIDGTGASRFVADVRIEGGRIAAIGAQLPTPDADVLDVAGKIVAPGFIDVHTHDDQMVLAAPQMLPKISQGVTTVVIGNCGISLAPLVHSDAPPPLNLLGGDKYVYPSMAAYVAALEKTRPAINVAALVGHSTLRVATMVVTPWRRQRGDESAWEASAGHRRTVAWQVWDDHRKRASRCQTQDSGDRNLGRRRSSGWFERSRDERDESQGVRATPAAT